jgi:hypothetical protein
MIRALSFGEHQTSPSISDARICGIADILQEFRQQRMAFESSGRKSRKRLWTVAAGIIPIAWSAGIGTKACATGQGSNNAAVAGALLDVGGRDCRRFGLPSPPIRNKMS